MVRNILTSAAALILGLLVFSASAELVLRALPVYRGDYGAEPDAGWPAHHLIPNSQYTFSAGWNFEDIRHGRVNNMGYVAPFDFVAGTSGVFVVGDSFIENQMNDYADSLQATLQRLLPDHPPVLGFGTSGATLPHDLGVAALITARFKPRWAVIVITRGDFVSGFASKPGFFKWAAGPDPGITQVPERRHGRIAEFIRDLALVAYARNNLRADISTLFSNKSRRSDAACRNLELSAADKALLTFAARELPRRFNLSPSHVVLVFDADRGAIYDPSAVSPRCRPLDAVADEFLAREAGRSGVKVIDMTPVFRAEYRRSGAHFDYLPTDGHWNATAHALAAGEVARYIDSRGGP